MSATVARSARADERGFGDPSSAAGAVCRISDHVRLGSGEIAVPEWMERGREEVCLLSRNSAERVTGTGGFRPATS